MSEKNVIIKLAKSNFKMKLYLMMKLPFAFLAGLRVVKIDNTQASISIPYKFLNKNPFRSVYFAALSMAAEFSTGILAMAAISATNREVSMLVLEMNARFLKKARTKVIFTCKQGAEIKEIVDKCLKTNEGQTIKVLSKGVDIESNEIAEFSFTWTFKAK
jgi:hypothetical protein